LGESLDVVNFGAVLRQDHKLVLTFSPLLSKDMAKSEPGIEVGDPPEASSEVAVPS
jgi:hypothetical protein